MHRHIASSAKKRRAQLKRKRAIKRGDPSPPPAPVHDRSIRKPFVKPNSSQVHPENVEVVQSARRLQSAFMRLQKEFVERTREGAIVLPLERPIPAEVAILPESTTTDDSFDAMDTTTATADDDAILKSAPATVVLPLSCPQRPEWRYDMTKESVAKNEQVQFNRWIDQTDDAVADWFERQSANSSHVQELMPHAPTTFERNIEVWRQLWRVTEISQILLILLDSRCPLLHYPPSLSVYLSDAYMSRGTRTILVLTKADIAGPVRAEAWTKFLRQKYPDLRIVQVESHLSRDSSSKKIYEPHLTKAFRQTLIDVLKETHAELLEPPESVKNDPEKLAKWKPKVKKVVDWEAVLNASGGQTGMVSENVAVPKVVEHPPRSEEDHGDETKPEILTIGLIGQPNVGKSSLLNALFGTTKVSASQTPGKTKHFQTLFWTPQVRLVDCPGLVFPNYTPMEAQVLSGILPISRVSAVPLCIHYVSRLLPLEKIFGLDHPRANEESEQPKREDKRTWRGERAKEREQEEREAREKEERRRKQWTAMNVLVAFALKKKWVTAQAARPDINRAGNYILRAVAESRIRWGFWPPGTDLSLIEEHQGEKGNGIWIPSLDGASSYDWDAESDDEHDDTRGHAGESEDEDSLTEGEDDGDEGEDPEDSSVTAFIGKFDALFANDNSSSDGEKEE